MSKQNKEPQVLISVQQLKNRPTRYSDLVRLIANNDGAYMTIGQLERNKAIEAIADTLNVVYRATDNKTALDDAQMLKSMEFIYYTYSYLHPAEIELAFDLHMAGIITVEFVGNALLQKNISKVMNVYAKYRQVQITAVKKVVTTSSDKSIDDILKIRKDFINVACDWYDKFCQGQNVFDSYLVSPVFDLLEKNGLIPEEFTEQFQEDAEETIKQNNIGVKSKMDIIKPNTEEWRKEVRGYVKKYALATKFKEFKKQKFDLRNDLISKLK